ncbi:MAG: NUDIX hydrolase [Pseudonocardiales bacterium]|nr:MAG: NUDIX hydrolase [Pseudonocardiales bacterium]
MPLKDDLLAEGEPEREYHAGIADRLARKRVAGGAIIRDHADRILFVEPIYKPHLEIPGGLAETNESPLAACCREVREEIGLDLSIDRLLVVDWVPEHGVWGDGLMFIFDGGHLDESQIASIRLPVDELTSFKFLTLDEALPMLKPSMGRRLRLACESLGCSGPPKYGEFGREV